MADPRSNHVSKDAKFVRLWADAGFDPMAKKDCAIAAGFSPSAAVKRPSKIISSIVQNKKLRKELERAGVNMKRIAEKISEQLDAVHPLAAKTAFDEEEGKWFGPPDNLARGNAIKMAINVHDAMPPQKLELDKTETKQIVITAEVVHRLERFQAQDSFFQARKAQETIDVEPTAGALEG